ncbi:E3 ubiquitin-protein ligase ZNRF3-like isoform X3 [Leptonychotes weddellii]|nr:E3 ubiquitin-protein ligase ZNRF3-like isoform X3 [Leptonychotes weddellii]
MHPLGLCNNNDEEDLYEYGWVGVVKLEQPELDPKPCLTVLGKAKRAVQRGATAVIFDVSENPEAIDQLNQGSEDPLKRPVVYVKGADAIKLMNIVNKQKVARARIQHRPPRQPTEYFDMGIFLAFFVVVSLVCLILLVKIKLKQRRSQVIPRSCPPAQVPRRLSLVETRVGARAPQPGPGDLGAAEMEENESKAYHPMSSLFQKGQNHKGRALGGLPARGFSHKMPQRSRGALEPCSSDMTRAVSPGSLVEMQTLKPYSRPAEPEAASSKLSGRFPVNRVAPFVPQWHITVLVGGQVWGQKLMAGVGGNLDVPRVA